MPTDLGREHRGPGGRTRKRRVEVVRASDFNRIAEASPVARLDEDDSIGRALNSRAPATFADGAVLGPREMAMSEREGHDDQGLDQHRRSYRRVEICLSAKVMRRSARATAIISSGALPQSANRYCDV